jgi:NAD-dependent deacetylase
MWEEVDPMEVASIYSFRRQPERFYKWVRPMVGVITSAEPNPGHLALAQLEAAGLLKTVITQNIDGLHQKAGSHSVLEVHGHLREAACLNCYRVAPAADSLEVVLEGGVPLCPECGGVVKPNVVLFGEQLPADVVIETMEHVRKADLMLVVGSSLLVMPVAHLPTLVHEGGGQVIVVNRQETYADEFAAHVFRGDLAEILPRLVQACVGES